MNKILKLVTSGALVAVILVAANAADTSSAPGASMSVPLATDAPSTYTVQRGDTLWGISSRYLKEPWYWPEIWYINPEIKNPHLIYPGDTLHLVYVAGADGTAHPQVRVERGNTVRLSPQVRPEALSQAVPAVPSDVIAAFMGKPGVLASEDAYNLPYVVSARDGRAAAGLGDEVYVRGLTNTDPGTRYSVVEIGQKLKDPDDGTMLGYMAVYTGAAQVIGQGTIDRQPTELTKLTLVESTRETVQGDRLISDHLDVPLDFVPHAPTSQVDGRVIAVVHGVTVIGQYEVVAINRGASQGIEPGHVLRVWQNSPVVPDRGGEVLGAETEFSWFQHHVQLPDERAGTMMVFRTYPRMSYALVLASTTDMRVGDAVRNP
jgi:hypothetical protein